MDVNASIMQALTGLRAERAKIDAAIEALEALSSPTGGSLAVASHLSSPADDDDAPGGGAAGVARVLRSAPGRGFTPEELAAAMRANGWEAQADDPPRAARAAANRLRRTEPRVRLRDGRFYFVEDADPDSARNRVAAHNDPSRAVYIGPRSGPSTLDRR